MAEVASISMKKQIPNINIKEYLKKLGVDKYMPDFQINKYIQLFQGMKITRNTVKKIIQPLFDEEPVFIEKITNGNIYKVYKAVLKSGGFIIVRISETPERFNLFLKEQWATKKAIEVGVPAPEILEVGNTIVPFPYMVVREAHGIPGNRYEGDRSNMIKEIGKYASMINKIPTNGFGEIFEWSHNLLSKKETWEDYLNKEFKIDLLIELLEKNKVLTPDNLKKLKKSTNIIKKWDFKPTLAHGDLLPKNVIVNKEGSIVGVIDWEAAKSHNGMIWDLSTTLNNIAPEEKKHFLEGYGMKQKDYDEIKREIDAFYVLKKSDMVDNHIKNNEPELLEKLKIKLNGVLDNHKA